MSKKKTKFDLVAVILLLFVFAALAMTVIGFLIDYYKVEHFGVSIKFYKFHDTLKNTKLSKMPREFKLMFGFSLAALITMGLSVLFALCTIFTKNKAIGFITVFFGLAAVGMSIGALVTTFDYCKTFTASFMNARKFTPAAGAWLLSIFGMIGGLSAVACAVKK